MMNALDSYSSEYRMNAALPRCAAWHTHTNLFQIRTRVRRQHMLTTFPTHSQRSLSNVELPSGLTTSTCFTVHAVMWHRRVRSQVWPTAEACGVYGAGVPLEVSGARWAPPPIYISAGPTYCRCRLSDLTHRSTHSLWPPKKPTT